MLLHFMNHLHLIKTKTSLFHWHDDNIASETHHCLHYMMLKYGRDDLMAKGVVEQRGHEAADAQVLQSLWLTSAGLCCCWVSMWSPGPQSETSRWTSLRWNWLGEKPGTRTHAHALQFRVMSQYCDESSEVCRVLQGSGGLWDLVFWPAEAEWG